MTGTCSSAVIEAQLAHAVNDALGRTCNRTEVLEQRRAIRVQDDSETAREQATLVACFDSHAAQRAQGRRVLRATRALLVGMGNLRQKLEEDWAQPRHIVTETGVRSRLLTA